MSMNRSRRLRLRRQQQLEHKARSPVATAAPEPPLPETVLAMLQGALVAQRRALTARSDPERADVDGARLELLQDIDLALDRVRRGTYGRCLRCARPMGVEELEAAPHAKACRRCLLA